MPDYVYIPNDFKTKNLKGLRMFDSLEAVDAFMRSVGWEQADLDEIKIYSSDVVAVYKKYRRNRFYYRFIYKHRVLSLGEEVG